MIGASITESGANLTLSRGRGVEADSARGDFEPG